MKALIQNAYMVGVHHYSFRCGEAAEIKALKWVKPEKLDWRLAYEVEYMDGKVDYVAVADVNAGNYAIISDTDFALGRMPEY